MTDEVRKLRNAIREKDISSIKDLFEKGLNVNEFLVSHPFVGSTPLHLACQTSYEIVKLLLEAGADPNLQDRKGQPPLYYALGILDNFSVCELLVEYGADIRIGTTIAELVKIEEMADDFEVQQPIKKLQAIHSKYLLKKRLGERKEYQPPKKQKKL